MGDAAELTRQLLCTPSCGLRWRKQEQRRSVVRGMQKARWAAGSRQLGGLQTAAAEASMQLVLCPMQLPWTQPPSHFHLLAGPGCLSQPHVLSMAALSTHSQLPKRRRACSVGHIASSVWPGQPCDPTPCQHRAAAAALRVVQAEHEHAAWLLLGWGEEPAACTSKQQDMCMDVASNQLQCYDCLVIACGVCVCVAATTEKHQLPAGTAVSPTLRHAHNCWHAAYIPAAACVLLARCPRNSQLRVLACK